MSEERGLYQDEPLEVTQKPKQRDKFKERVDRENAQTIEVMSTPGGRAFMARLMAKTGLWELSYTGNAETNFREGRRSIGLHLYSEFTAVCPELYEAMMRESAPKKEKNNVG